VIWLVIDVDEGVKGAFDSKKEALAEFLPESSLYKRHSYGPGAYEYQWWYPGDPYDGDGFSLQKLTGNEWEGSGWAWAVRAWEKAGRPMGRLLEPCGRELAQV
jgi:hypothetical protein